MKQKCYAYGLFSWPDLLFYFPQSWLKFVVCLNFKLHLFYGLVDCDKKMSHLSVKGILLFFVSMRIYGA